MRMIDCYEPAFVRSFLSHNPDSPLSTRMTWQHEIRQSLMLTETASCEAALGDPDAFALHVSQCAATPESPVLSLRAQTLNQAALNTVTLAGLTPELRLYALGIMLSWSDKLPGESDETLASLASQPTVLANFVEQGQLQQQFALLPAVPQLQRTLLTLMGSLSFDWSILPDSARKTTLPLQVSLLMLQDANSELLLLQQLQTQWHKTHTQYFANNAWIFSNYLIYRLYHDTFPDADRADVTQRYFELVSDFFLLRTFFSLWTLDDSTLNHNDIYALFALFERWRHGGESTSVREQLLATLPADYLLSAFSLLIC